MASRSPRRILVVEDDECTRETVGLILQAEGYEVSCATNGVEALDHLQSDPLPDCILLDLRMPIMDGLQFRRRQMDDPRLADVPVIVVTAEQNLRSQALALRVQGYLQKPVELDQLLGTVKRVC